MKKWLRATKEEQKTPAIAAMTTATISFLFKFCLSRNGLITVVINVDDKPPRQRLPGKNQKQLE
jgi:hypothetical protein